MTRVLPLPAPARTRSGPSPAVTASRCGGFRSSRKRVSSESTGRLYRAIRASPTRSFARSRLLDRDALREVPGLVHVAAESHPDMIREKLQGNYRDQRRQEIGADRHLDQVLNLRREGSVAGVHDGDDLALAGEDLFDVAEHALVRAVARGQRDDGQPVGDERDGAMLHLATGVALGVDVGDLLELERAFEGDRKLEPAPEIEDVTRAGELAGDRRNLAVELERLLDETWDLDEVVDPLLHVLGRQGAALATEPEAKEVGRDDHRRECLRRRDADLRSRVHVEDARRLPRQGRAHNVGDREDRAPLEAGRLHGPA